MPATRLGSALERRFELCPLAFAKLDRYRQSFQMLIDNLVTESRLLLLEKCNDLRLAVEQSDDRLAHPRQSAIRELIDHGFPVTPDEVPTLVTRNRVAEQRMHQEGSI